MCRCPMYCYSHEPRSAPASEGWVARLIVMMTRKWLTGLLVGVLLVPVLFEVQWNPQFAMPRTVARADEVQEARYRQCVTEQVDEATRQALAAADNPDVQSLMIRMRQKEVLADCRLQHPARRVDVDEPLRVNLLDFRWRF
jgi:hypothetical protein